MGKIRRIPRNYDGKDLTGRSIKDLLPSLLETIQSSYSGEREWVLAAWAEILDASLLSMTRVRSFSEGVLFVDVKNSTLYSILSGLEKSRLLAALKAKVPSVTVKDISFRMGL